MQNDLQALNPINYYITHLQFQLTFNSELILSLFKWKHVKSLPNFLHSNLSKNVKAAEKLSNYNNSQCCCQ